MDRRLLLIVNIFIVLSIIVWIMPSAIAQYGEVQNPPNNPQPNIEIIGISFSDSAPNEGEEIVVYTKIVNNGSVSVSNITITVYVDGEEIANISTIGLEANSSAIVESRWSSEGGTHTISATASIDGKPITREPYGEKITVTIGDVLSLVIALLVIGVVILGTSISPSTINRPKKKTLLKMALVKYGHKIQNP